MTAHTDITFTLDESLALASHEIESKQYAQALGRLKALAQEEPAAPAAVLLLARLHGQLHLPQRAQAGFERFLALEPNATHERFELGMTLFEQGQYGGALQTWYTVLLQVPQYPPALYFSAVAHAQTGARAQAERTLQELFEVTNEDNMYHERGRELAQRLSGAPTLGAAVPLADTPRH
jgi:predicted Zn-dependent protease